MAFTFSYKDRELDVHNYDELTGEYLNTVTLKVEAHTGLPAHATCKKLPTLKADQRAVFKSGKWQALVDNRGPVWDTATKVESELTVFGGIPEGKTNVAPSKFDHWNGTKWLLNSEAQLADAKKKAYIKVKHFATQCRIAIAGDADHYETTEWLEKKLRAQRIIDNTPLPDDEKDIAAEAAYRNKGETVIELSTRILVKAKRYKDAGIVIKGLASGAKTSINNAISVEEIDNLLPSLETMAQQELAKL